MYRSQGLTTFFRRSVDYARRKVVRDNTRRVRLIRRHIHNLQKYDAAPHPYKIVDVDPEEIQTYTQHFAKWESVGLITGGGWDIDVKLLRNKPKHRAVAKRFGEGVDWDETKIYDELLSRIEKHGNADGCKDLHELKQRYADIDKLYNSMKAEGYKREYHDSQPPWWGVRDLDYIACHIGRHGEFIFEFGGNHRLAIAKVLQIEQLPVWILARHSEWQEIRDEVYNAEAPDDLSADTKQYLDHPDIRQIRSW